jgi:predicted RecA/RadA family phage recombinase
MNTGQVDRTAAAAETSGTVRQLEDGRAAVLKSDLAASGKKGAEYTVGIFKVTCATGTTFSAGELIYWDSSANTAIAAGSCEDGDFYVGVCVVTKTTELWVLTDMNVRGGEQRGVFTSRAVSIDHADTAEHILIDAEDNVGGLMVMALVGMVTEAPVGSSEDQLIITLYDEDDAALDTLTTTNTTPDAIGDIICGLLSHYTVATGGVFTDIPAGKAAYVKVTQATVGGSIAGKVTCRVIVCPLI